MSKLSITLILSILWGDDFEPDYAVKGNRQSVHISTLTSVSPSDSLDSMFYTFPVAIASKGANYTRSTKHFVDSIKQFMNKDLLVFYSSAKRGIVNVRRNIIACLQDQPEQRETLYLARGNSNYHGRSGYSMNTGQVRRGLVPCDEGK
jgi:hypothetical protein